MDPNDYFWWAFLSTAVGLKNVLDMSTSCADYLCIVATVYAKGKPEERPEKAENTNTPSVCSASCSLSPGTHSVKSTHATRHR